MFDTCRTWIHQAAESVRASWYRSIISIREGRRGGNCFRPPAASEDEYKDDLQQHLFLVCSTLRTGLLFLINFQICAKYGAAKGLVGRSLPMAAAKRPPWLLPEPLQFFSFSFFLWLICWIKKFSFNSKIFIRFSTVPRGWDSVGGWGCLITYVDNPGGLSAPLFLRICKLGSYVWIVLVGKFEDV